MFGCIITSSFISESIKLQKFINLATKILNNSQDMDLEENCLKITPQQMGINSTNIEGINIDCISLANFPGKTVEGYLLAHIYWSISYKFIARPVTKQKSQSNYPIVIAQPSISMKSWMNRRSCHHELMQHEYGHYLISCCCALQFQEKVNHQYKQLFKGSSVEQFKQWCAEIFRATMKKYCAMERDYDKQTQHYCNEDEQRIWEAKIVSTINEHDRKSKQRLKSRPQSIGNKSRQIKRDQIKSQSQNKAKLPQQFAKIKHAGVGLRQQIRIPAYRIRAQKTTKVFC